MTEYTPKPGEKCVTSCRTAEAVLITPTQWVLKDLQDDHLFIVDQSDFDSVKPAPTARDEMVEDLERIWLDGPQHPIGPEATAGFRRIYDEGYRKLPSREVLRDSLVRAWTLRNLKADIPKSLEARLFRAIRETFLDLIYGDDANV